MNAHFDNAVDQIARASAILYAIDETFMEDADSKLQRLVYAVWDAVKSADAEFGALGRGQAGSRRNLRRERCPPQERESSGIRGHYITNSAAGIAGGVSIYMRRPALLCNRNGHQGTASGNTTSTETKSTATAASDLKVDTAKYIDKTLAGAYKTTASLNLRAGAGTAKAVLAVVPKGGIMRNYGYYNILDGKKWLYVQYTTGGKTYTGYCSSAYLTKN